MHTIRILLAAAIAIVLVGCSAVTTISSPQRGATVTIAKSVGSGIPRTESFSTTSFGNYGFCAEAPGYEPFYGLLPLKFNGGYLALDILFFAPAAFFNLREVYAYYDFDIGNKYVRFKKKSDEEWNIFVPLESDAAQVKALMAPK